MKCLDIAPKKRWLSAPGFIHSMASFMGTDHTEVQVDALSGFAFRNTISEGILPGTINSSVHWFDVFQPAFDKLGIITEIVISWKGQECYDSFRKHVWNRISEHISNNKPVLIWDSFEFALVVGIKDNQITINGIAGRKTLYKAELGSGDIPAIFAVFPIKKIEINKLSASLMALRSAVLIGLSETPTQSYKLGQSLGVETYKKWQEELGKDYNIFGNAQHIRLLLEARRSSALFLAELANQFKGIPRNLLLRASERFAQVHAKLSEMAKLFPFLHKDTDYPKVDIRTASQLLEDCYIMETEGFNLMATSIENIDAQGYNEAD